ncbi:hypothetical protein CRUP_026147 [Coryphaenoides rupestris]|nr:hypothetical protein CRUP_026147 [Coryphaenoides rupestris]
MLVVALRNTVILKLVYVGSLMGEEDAGLLVKCGVSSSDSSEQHLFSERLLSGGDMSPRWEVVPVLMVALLLACGAAASDILYRIPEEQPPNSLITSLASDRGLPDTGHLYKLEVGSPHLRVDSKTGDIYTTEIPIDREKLPDCRNLFDGDKCYLEFEMATDRDSGINGVAEYSLNTGPDADQLFSLQVAVDADEKLPQLVVMGNLDREVKDSYDLNIRVVDGGKPPRASSALLRVTVTDQNDNLPKPGAAAVAIQSVVFYQMIDEQGCQRAEKTLGILSNTHSIAPSESTHSPPLAHSSSSSSSSRTCLSEDRE